MKCLCFGGSWAGLGSYPLSNYWPGELLRCDSRALVMKNCVHGDLELASQAAG